MEKLEPSLTTVGTEGGPLLWETGCRFLIVSAQTHPRPGKSTIGSFPPQRNSNICPHKTWICMFSGALLIKPENANNPNAPQLRNGNRRWNTVKPRNGIRPPYRRLHGCTSKGYYAKGKKWSQETTKELGCDSTCTNSGEQADPKRQKVTWQLLRARGEDAGGAADGRRYLSEVKQMFWD